jgi:hypothetical protein
MKITKLLLFVVAALAFACSKDDDETPLEKQTLSLAGSAEVITVPTAMKTSENAYAQEAVDMITEVNGMSQYLALLKPPAEATKSAERIVPANGRVNATGDVVVYSWTVDDYKYGYQVSESSDSYVFEVFMMYPGQTGWLKYFHAEEKKDRSSGFLKVYDIWSDEPAVMLSYDWSHSGDIFTFTADFMGSTAKLILNKKTKAGSIVYTYDGVKEYEMTWDAAGNGTWAYYDEEGAITEQGVW